MTENDTLNRALADIAGLGARASAKLNGDRADVMFDVGGLDAGTRDAMEAQMRVALLAVPGVTSVRVLQTAERTARRIVAVGSGKGGVGKSTLSANLAIALARSGKRVGLIDADIQGPSQPKLLGTEGMRPEARDKQIIPVKTRFGVPMLSMGHLVAPDKAVAWRGPMQGSALTQLVEGDWGDAELLILDLPPGTGDIQLTMVQKHKPAGAVIVSTPQDLALIDARRAIDLFVQAGVPILGLVENMAGYACPHCGEVSDPFGSGGAEAAARELGIDFLGRVPLDTAIRTASDAGEPPAAGDSEQGKIFADIAARLAAKL